MSRRIERDTAPIRPGGSDLAGRRTSAAFVWGIPVTAILRSASAYRCRRTHRHFIGPLFFVAALLSALHGWGVVSLVPGGYESIANGTFVGTLVLGCLPELLFGRYLDPRGDGPGADREARS